MTKMNDTVRELVIAKTQLAVRFKVISERESREQRIRDKAQKAYDERRQQSNTHRTMTAEERKAVMQSLSKLNRKEQI